MPVVTVVKQSSPFKGQPVEKAIDAFFGKLDRWPSELDGINFTQAQIVAICQRICITGECLWHAQAVVLGADSCNCMDCVTALKEGGR